MDTRDERTATERALARGLLHSRWLIVVPVVVLLLSAVGAFVYGAGLFVHDVTEIAAHPLHVAGNIGRFLVVVDLMLIGATLLIAAVGFFELFIGRVEHGASRLPGWLVMSDLNELKARVIAMAILVMTVTFVEEVVDQVSGPRALEFGGGVAVVILALTAFLRYGASGGES
jgi:uncharacterized membrane protein YqhA